MIEIITGVICSIVSSYIFWFLTFKYSGTNVIFSKCIEKSKIQSGQPDSCKYRYRVQIVNIGYRDLLEVRCFALMTIKLKGKEAPNLVLLHFGENNAPLLPGKKNRENHFPYKHALYLGEEAFREFAKRNLYRSDICDKAESKTLSLDDIFSVPEYKDSCKIQLYVYGNDLITGARRMFKSKEYQPSKKDEIKCGIFDSDNSLATFHDNHTKEAIIDYISKVS